MTDQPLKWAAYTVFLAYDGKPPTSARIEDLLQADVRIHNVTAGKECEPCARFSSMHPAHPGESANPDPSLCAANMRLRVEDFAKRLSAIEVKPGET